MFQGENFLQDLNGFGAQALYELVGVLGLRGVDVQEAHSDGLAIELNAHDVAIDDSSTLAYAARRSAGADVLREAGVVGLVGESVAAGELAQTARRKRAAVAMIKRCMAKRCFIAILSLKVGEISRYASRWH